MVDTDTTFMDKCVILSDLWMGYRTDEEFKDFIEYADLALPLAYMISNEIVSSTDTARQLVEEAWRIFLGGLNIPNDIGFESLEHLLDYTEVQ